MADEIPESTRRAVLQSAAAALGVGAVGTASGHPGAYEKDAASASGNEGFPLDDHGSHHRADTIGYHSIGDTGRASLNGRPGQRHGGDRNAEVRTHGDIAVTSFRASDAEDAGRRMAVLDISEFNDATTKAELKAAELSVHSILRNFSAEANGATDIKLSNDGNYAFLGTQALVPYDGGSNGEVNESDPRGNAETTGGVVAVDITDPARPQTVDRADEPFTTGCHNLYHHRIDSVDYVFACKDIGLLTPDSGVYVFRFDRDPGKLTLVNRWTADGNTARGEVGAEHGLSYVHDVEVHDDPRTGRPTAYVADWDRGMRVLDVSDPTNIEHVGQFDMYQSHFAAPFPELIEIPGGEERRVAVASHEEPDERFDQRSDVNAQLYNTPHADKTNPNSTGTVFLIDCEGIYPGDPNHDDSAGPTQLGELDNWTWKNVDTGKGFDPNTPRQERFEAIRQPSFSFKLSPHNSQPEVHEIGGQKRYIIHQGHYHGGVRYLEVDPGTDDGLTGGERRNYRPEVNPNVPAQTKGDTIGWINNTTDWSVSDIGHARPTNDAVDNLSPDFWSSVEHNGLSYHGDRGAGVYVTKHESIPMDPPRPPVEVSRENDSSVYLGGSTARVDITIDAFERDGEAANLLVRDRMPSGYEVVGGNDTTTYSQGVRTAVEFTDVTAPDEAGTQRAVKPGESRTLTYFLSVPEDPGNGRFGPVEISGDGGDTWVTVGGTTDSSASTGVGINL